ncbi:MAG: acyl-CoA thioesterase domain-containing protein [Aeromicrobium sp.]
MIGGLQSRLALEPAGGDRFVGHAADVPGWVYGGEVAAQSVSAANATIDGDRSLHSLQASYLRRGHPAVPIDYEVARLREGRSFSTRQVVATQEGRTIFTALMGYHVAEQGFEHQDAMPQVPRPEDLPTIVEANDSEGKGWSTWTTQHPDIELRPVAPDVDDPQGRRQFWFRYAFDDDLDARRQSVYAVYASDFTMISSIRLPHEPRHRKTYFMSTLNHNFYVHRPFLATDWHLIEHFSPVATGGRGLSMSRVFTPDGLLVASGFQEGLARPFVGDDS